MVTLGRGQIIDLARAGRRLQHPEVPGTLQGRHQQQRPGPGRKPRDPGREQLLQPPAKRQHRRKREYRRTLCLAQLLRQLQQGERIALRRAQHPARHQRIKVRKPRRHQLGSRLVIQGLQLIFRQAAPVKVAVRAGPAGGEQPRPAAAEPSRHETQHPGAGPVDPGQVVHDQQKRHSRGRVPQQGQRGIGYQQPVWHRPGSQAQGYAQGSPVGGAELAEVA